MNSDRKGVYRILIIVCHSLGELDVLFPLIAALRRKYPIDVEMIFTVEKIYNQFNSSKFYRYCIKNLGCKVTFMTLPNKFDLKFRKYMTSAVGFGYFRVIYWLFYLRNLPFLICKLFRADIYMHEYTNQYRANRPLYWANKLLGKRVIVYSHAHSITLDTKATRKVRYADRVCCLQFHEQNKECMLNLGFDNRYTIGYPKFFKEWTDMVKKYNGSEFDGKDIILIYTRGVSTWYMDEDKYVGLLVSSCRVIRKMMGDILIVIKPHPREDIEFIKRVLEREKVSNYIISWEHAAVLAMNAKIAISFFGSTILDSLSLGVPSVEYYIEAEKFRETEPEGSAYKKLGIHSVNNERGLEDFIEMVLDGRYKVPSVIDEISQIKDIRFLELIK